MARRYLKREQWRDLIAQQEASGQSVSAFCRDHDLLPKTFWNQRKALREAVEQVNKGLVAVEPPSSMLSSGQMRVTCRGVELVLSGSVSPAWVAHLMRELADAPVS